MNKFIHFLDTLKPHDPTLVESIKDGYQTILESVSQIVYHNTDTDKLYNILHSNQFHLTNMIGGHADNQSKNRFFYLSMSRIKHGGYAQDTNVVLVLDGDKLNQTNKGISVDYWGTMKYKTTSEQGIDHFLRNRENEDRVTSNKPVIEKANTYIKEIHVSLDRYNDTEYEHSNNLSNINKLASDLNIDIFYYTDKEAWKLQDKRKSIKPNFIKPTEITDNNTHKLNSYIKGHVDALVKYYNNPELQLGYDEASADGIHKLMSAIHNNKSNPETNKYITTLTSIMKKEQVSTLSQFTELLHKRHDTYKETKANDDTENEKFIKVVTDFMDSHPKVIEDMERGDGTLLIFDVDTDKYNNAEYYYNVSDTKITSYRFDIKDDPISDLDWVNWNDISNFTGLSMEELKEMAQSSDVRVRAQIYVDVADYYGWDNIDNYPLSDHVLDFFLRKPHEYTAN